MNCQEPILAKFKDLFLNKVNGVRSVVACTLVCETGSTGSIPVGYPIAVEANQVEASV